ncbi:MAG TPA: hypothetical protein G4N94_14050 [Caldilineae bacterium]|nr:hypothetical protein [Caldilineae bacterium]
MTERGTKQTQSPANTLSPEMQTYLDSQLEEGERLLWASGTNVKARMRKMRVVVIGSVFMLFFCSGMFLLMETPSRVQLALFSLLFWLALPAVAIWGQRDHLRRTIYAITDRRALILSLDKPKRTESYPPEKIEFIHPVTKAGGRGDLYFVMIRGKGQQWRMRYRHGFLDIANVEDVADLMRETFPSPEIQKNQKSNIQR